MTAVAFLATGKEKLRLPESTKSMCWRELTPIIFATSVLVMVAKIALSDCNVNRKMQPNVAFYFAMHLD
jgi:hypothetical protein